MVSLAQVALFGIAGFVVGNATTNGNTKGLNLGWNPWWGVARRARDRGGRRRCSSARIASRSVGIYFLMITLTFSVIANLFFGQVTDVSGFGGISGIPTPDLIGNVDAHPNRLYYVALGVSLVVYAVLRYLVRTPFGLTLQGIARRPGAHGLARLQRRAPPHDRLRLRRRSSRRSAASSSSGGTATSTPPRSTSARRSTCS